MKNDAVTYLLECYFHEDWPDDYDSLGELIDDFVARDPHRAAAAPTALRTLLQGNDETSLKSFCEKTNSAWDFARMGGGTYTDWFRMLLERIEDRLARSEK